jgi:predicted TIM-barrel fold metal-dependent hydrolase
VFPAGTFPQVAIDDPKMYPVYQACVDLGIPVFCCAGIPGPRLKFAPQEVSRIIYGGYFPMGLSLERIFSDMPHVPFKDEVWPKFLSENARRVLKIGT